MAVDVSGGVTLEYIIIMASSLYSLQECKHMQRSFIFTEYQSLPWWTVAC